MTKKKAAAAVEDTAAETIEAEIAVDNVSVSDTKPLTENTSENIGGAVVGKPETAEPTVERHLGAKKFIYLGASLPNNALKRNTVFDGTFEEVCSYLQAEIAAYPLIKELLIPVDRFTVLGVSDRISSLNKALLKSFERRN